MADLQFVNPIPSALAHYSRELTETVSGVGAGASLAEWVRPVEGMNGALGRAQMLSNALMNVASAKRSNFPIMQLWPSLGILEARLWSSRSQPRAIVLHDPVPISPRYGHGKWSEWWAKRANPSTSPLVVVHSEYALSMAEDRLPNHRVIYVLHPILSKQTRREKTAERSVIVAGQFKTERDLNLLAKLGPLLRSQGWTTRIVGRGWPKVSGWDVDARFVPEDELDDLLGSAWVLLLPYKNYFQSGIAIRALEQGTLTVGPRSSFLEALYGSSSTFMVDGDGTAEDYVAAISSVRSGQAVGQVFDKYAGRVQISWRSFLDSSGVSTESTFRPAE